MRIRSRVALLVSILLASFGTLQSAEAVPGDIMWEHRDDVSYSPLAIFAAPDGGTVYMTDEGFGVHAFDALTGELRWRRSWGKRYAITYGSAISPDGSVLFLVGDRNNFSGNVFATVAFDTATGERMWVRLLDFGPDFLATSIAVSPGGDAVFVTGGGAVAAYRASTGARMWVTKLGHRSYGEDLAVSADGLRLYVVTDRFGSRNDPITITIALSTRIGRRLWMRRFSQGDNWDSSVRRVGVTASGVVVTGSTYPIRRADRSRSFTLAYAAASGRTLWTRLYNGSPDSDYPVDLDIDPSAGSVLLTGASGYDSDIYTVAYDLTTGETRWTARYDGGGDFDEPNDLAVDPATSSTYVLGTVYGDTNSVLDDFGLIAYDTLTGELKWDARYGGPGELREQADALALSPNGNVLFVTGSSADDQASYDTVVLAYETV